MISALVNYINSPEKKKPKISGPSFLSNKEKCGIGNNTFARQHILPFFPCDKPTKNDEPLLPLSGGRMKTEDSIRVVELWNWYCQNVREATQAGFTEWCGIGIGSSGMSKKLKNPIYASDRQLAPHKFWYRVCGHRKKISMHLIHKEKHPLVADYLCGDCYGTSSAMARDKICNEALRECLDLQTGLRKHKWPNRAIVIDVGKVVDEQLANSVPELQLLNADFNFKVVREMKFRVHRYDAPKPSPGMENGCLLGASYPAHFQPNEDEVLDNLNDGSFGLVVFPTEDEHEPDFLFLGNSGMTNECIRSNSSAEIAYMRQMKTERRAGTATGQFIPLHEVTGTNRRVYQRQHKTTECID